MFTWIFAFIFFIFAVFISRDEIENDDLLIPPTDSYAPIYDLNFEENLRLEEAPKKIKCFQSENETNYFTYLPYQGISNQINALVRGLILAKSVNRTLAIPPLVRSQHNDVSGPEMADWEIFFNFCKLRKNYEFCFLAPQDLHQPPNIKPFSCLTYGKWESAEQYGVTTKRYLDHLSHSVDFIYEPKKKSPISFQALRTWLRGNNDKVACIANLQHSIVAVDLIADLHYSEVMNNLIFQIRPDLIDSPYDAIHWRRGDFQQACMNKNYQTCCPAESDLKNWFPNLNEARVYIATDEQDPQILESLSEHGFTIANWKSLLEFQSPEIKTFAPLFLDIALLTSAETFYGSEFSTISRHVTIRRKNRVSRSFNFLLTQRLP